MARTIAIQNSDEVMAMLGTPGAYYRGRWEDVKITGVSKDKEVPLEVRKSLVGLIIPTIFTKEKIEEQTGLKFPVPDQSRLAYTADVISVLDNAGICM